MEFEDIQNTLFFHHENLKQLSIDLCQHDIVGIEGNIYSYNGIDHVPSMVNKMKHLFYLAQECEGDVLEIGFNAGNSALIFLMANPKLRVYAFDICIHSYVKPCVDYLNRHFGNRVILMEGDSLETLPKLKKEFGKSIGIFHVDGLHTLEGIESDLAQCYRLAWGKSYIAVDDTNIQCIKNEYDKYVQEGKIRNCPSKVILDTTPWFHKIGVFNLKEN